MQAPDFTLPDKNGNPVTLSSYRGKKVVVYFYPKDNTSGCTKQALGYKDLYEKFQAAGVEVIGISKDSQASHVRFADKYELPFVLVSDPDLVAIQGFDVWQEKKLYGKVSMGVVRTSYVVGEDGTIVFANPKCKGDADPGQVAAFLGL
jgi:peroxiredoxin Q/BCP